MLFSGPESVGKRTVARALAAELLTAGGQGTNAAEKLRLLASGNHPDYHVCTRAEDKKDISVEAVRDLSSTLRLRPYYQACRVTVIDNAHEMSIAASNALLMTLEEPCADSYLILVTHAPQRLPATILSRCQTVSFGELSSEEILQAVSRIPGMDQKRMHGAAALCSGSLEALELGKFVDPVKLTIEDQKGVTNHLNDFIERAVRLRKEIDGFITRCLEDDVQAAFAASLASHLAAEADESSLVWRIFHRALREALRSASRSDIARVAHLLEMSLTAERLIRERNVNPQLQLTSLLLEELR